MATITMLLNQSYYASTPTREVHFARPRQSSSIVVWQALVLALTIVKIVLPLYPLVLLLLTYRPIQRCVLYGHKKLGWRFPFLQSNDTLNNPETHGFLRNQVTNHYISTTDGQTLHAWLMMPIGAYKKHENVLTKSWSAEEAREIARQIMRSDRKAVIVVYFHGSGDNIAAQQRCAAYRNLATGDPNHLYVLSFDYRGFGRSSGFPTEEGLIVDSVSVLSWIEKKLDIPRKRILLAGHGLGASVAVAAVQRVLEKNRFAEYAGLVLCSGFTDVPNLALRFKLGGFVPLLGPLNRYKASRTWIETKLLADSWRTEYRLRHLVKNSEVLRLSILHAEDDNTVSQSMSDILYGNCVDEVRQIGTFTESNLDLGTLGNAKELKANGRLIRRVSVKTGGHNAYMSWHTASFEVSRIFTMAGAIG